MEKENAALQAKQSENEIKKMKLGYDSIIPCDKELLDFWETTIERDVNSSKLVNKKDMKFLYQAMKNGIPRQKRGDVWKFLSEQHSLNSAPPDPQKFPNFNTPYKVLLKSLTEHQHAIFIDLGRTFPNHMFYKDPLGVGQLSLFNLLKAYSILDPELGYCQGLGFICGVLLLHVSSTFFLFQISISLCVIKNSQISYLVFRYISYLWILKFFVCAVVGLRIQMSWVNYSNFIQFLFSTFVSIFLCYCLPKIQVFMKTLILYFSND